MRVRRSVVSGIVAVALVTLAGPQTNALGHESGPRKQASYENSNEGRPVWAGVRSSRYGIDPFPSASGWANAMTTMSSYYDGSAPVVVWLTGEIEFNGEQSGQHFNFPNPGGDWDATILFDDEDQNEEFLDYFDEHGIKVWLQVEPGFSPMDQLIEIVYRQYGHHPSVIGFGVDVEWYHSTGDGGGNDPVTDELAQQWEQQVEAVDPEWTLFLKHFETSSLPPNYRGDIVFIDDSQGFDDFDGFKSEMLGFAETYAPNPVIFQVGYESDKPWWSTLPEPVPQTIGAELVAAAPQEQVGVVWVDFTLRDVLPTD